MKIYLKLVVISAFFLPSLALVTPWCLAGELIGRQGHSKKLVNTQEN
jgi:hypothetical protein